jgi:hypothetical protein
MDSNYIWYNPEGADLGGLESGSFNAPYTDLSDVFNYIQTNIGNSDNWFILVRPRVTIREDIDFTNPSNTYNNLFNGNKKLYIIGMSSQEYSDENEILSDIPRRYGPFIKSRFLASIQQNQVYTNYNDRKNFFEQNASVFDCLHPIKLNSNVTIINFEVRCELHVIINTYSSNELKTILYKCLFLDRVKVYEHGMSLLGSEDDIFNPSGSFTITNSNRVIVNLCMFYNIHSGSQSSARTNECDFNYRLTDRTAALEIRASKADIYDNVFLSNEIGIIAICLQDTTLNNSDTNNTTSICIKNCKIFNSIYEGLIATFPGNSSYVNKIINVDCSYTREGNGFKVRNCNLVKCKALWNKYYGFILLGNKYLYKCHALNNQTGFLIASTTAELFRLPYFKFNNHTSSVREYDTSNNNSIKHRITNFYNCSVRGSLGGSGIVFSVYSSFSLFVNCEISGNQGSLESFYDITNYTTEYYFTGGGIKGFKDNNLCFMNCSIVGNLGYGICIIDDLKRILSTTTRTFLDYDGQEITTGSDEFTSEFIVASCDGNDVKSFEHSNPDIYRDVSRGRTGDSTWRSITIDSNSAETHCDIYTTNIKEASSYVGHIILINTIVSTNRGGQIVKLFDFKNTFPNRFLEINSLIDNYKSDKFFTFPKNVCAWNPYKGIFETGDGVNNQRVSLFDIITVYNPIPQTLGNELIYRGGSTGVFKAFQRPDDVDNARDDLDLRFNSFVDKDSSTYTYSDSTGDKKILEGKNNLFDGDEINDTILAQINNNLDKSVDNTVISGYTFNDLFFNNNKTYLPDISHYKNIGYARESLGNFRDDNFIEVSNKFFERETDVMELILDDIVKFNNTHKQFLELRQNIQRGTTDIFGFYLKQLLSYDFDELPRDLDSSNGYYIGCFEKHNYCNYQYNNTGRIFDKNRSQFTNRVNCCNDQSQPYCTSNNTPIGIGQNYPSGLERSLIVDYTTQEVSFEQEEMNSLCQQYQDNLNTRTRTDILPDLSSPEVAEDSCIIPNFEMYDFNGTYFESRFICGNNCNFSWNTWEQLIESGVDTLTLGNTNFEVHFRTGNLVKLNEETRNSLRNFGVSSNQDLLNAEKLYPNICPASGEFEFDETNEELFCNRESIDSNVQRWFCDKRNSNQLPLVPDGCPSFGGKKCPVSNIQFAMVTEGEDPASVVTEDSFEIENVVDDLLNSGSISVDSVVSDIDSSREIDPSDPNYIQSQCLNQGYFEPSRGLSGLIEEIKKARTFENEPEKIPWQQIIMLIIFIIILIGAVMFM